MKQLTKAEEEIMQILWKLKKARVAEVIEEMSEAKAYTINLPCTMHESSNGKLFQWFQ